jgi:hypothetical protein
MTEPTLPMAVAVVLLAEVKETLSGKRFDA